MFGYIVGHLIFFTFIEFGVEDGKYDKIFFVWQNLFYTGTMAWWSLYLVGTKEIRIRAKYLLIFSLFMLAWEIVVSVLGVDVNHPWAVMAAFLILVGVLSILFIKEVIHVRKK